MAGSAEATSADNLPACGGAFLLTFSSVLNYI
jgi:hypothetical protein